MGTDKEILAAWMSPCKLKHFGIFNVSVLTIVLFVGTMMRKLSGYELSGTTFLGSAQSAVMIDRVLLALGGIGFLAGIVMLILGLLALRYLMGLFRIIALFLLGSLNVAAAIFLIYVNL